MKYSTILITLLLTLDISFAAQASDSLSPRDKALIEAAFHGELADVQVILKKGASIEATDSKNRTALMWAAANGHTSVVEFLHGKGADINAKDSDGATALMYSIRKSFAPTAEFLLKNGAEVNAQSSKRGVTALMIAAGVGDVSIVRLLLEHGADKSLAAKDGKTAVDRARLYGHSAVVTLLEDSPEAATVS